MSNHSKESGSPEVPGYHNPDYYKKLLAEKRTPHFRRVDKDSNTFFALHIPDVPMDKDDRIQPKNGFIQHEAFEVVSHEGQVKGDVTIHDLSPREFHNAAIVFLSVFAAQPSEPQTQK